MKYLLLKRFILYLILFTSVSQISFAQNDIIRVGDEMPSFVLLNTDATTSLSSKFKGKVILINFFATWCGPCLKELPVIENTIWKKYKDNNDFVLIAVGRGHTLEEITLFKEKTKYSFNMFPDSDKKIYTRFAKAIIPRNYIIDKDGKIVYTSVGYEEIEFAELKKRLTALLGK